MGDVKNLTANDAVEKIREIAKDANICMFVTDLSKLPLMGRPMATQEVDEKGNIWFMSDRNSDKNRDIEKDPQVQLFYSHTGNYEYLSIYGSAEIVNDRTKIEKLWTPMAKTWFKEGKDDPNISLIKVTPENAYYWDTKNNKMVSLIKFAMGALGFAPKDDGGVEGKLKPY
ncbi:MAG TPA: pyridoxamine 5'-phosphate oxidase family protein [Chitinophagaceae bacterium]|nr:pyridoxamine 5'-phosphate oxidase family protein [Chitinophagaceae bacterium]